MDTKNVNRNKSIQVVSRCFAILELIADNKGEICLAEIGKKLGLPNSTVHRILASLTQLGYVDQNQQNGHYRLGLKILFLSNSVLETLDLRRQSRSILQELQAATGETTNLVVLDNDEVVYVEKVDSKASVRVFSLIGRRAPVHVTGAGKVLLSELAQQDVTDILRRKGMPRLTHNSLTSIPDLLIELEKVRRHGYAYDDEECELGARCIAAPVRNHTGRICASISVSGPITRLTKKRLKELTPVVVSHALKLSKGLGFREELLVFSLLDSH